MNSKLNKLIVQWTRVGAMFNVRASSRTPDIERLLLDTSRFSPQMARLFIMGATWLNRYGDLIAKHRLKRLIRDELEVEHQACLGLLLDMGQQGTHPKRFESVMHNLKPASQAGPLFESQRKYPSATSKAKRKASPIALRWNLWVEPVDLKEDTLRPAGWLMKHNPIFILRADFRGDLRSSILASQQFDEGAGGSELALSRAAGGSRAQVRQALNNLELTGRIQRVADGRCLRIELNQLIVAVA